MSENLKDENNQEFDALETENDSAEPTSSISTEDAGEDAETSEQGDNCSQEKKLDEKTKLADEYFGRLQRLQADFDNFRRRTNNEKTELAKYASEKIITQLLPVLDNFERAIQSIKQQGNENVLSGIEMIYRQFMDILEKEGLKAIESLGQPFDPNLQEAVMKVENDEYPENTVIEEFQKGYTLKEKVIRPAMVKVSG